MQTIERNKVPSVSRIGGYQSKPWKLTVKQREYIKDQNNIIRTGLNSSIARTEGYGRCGYFGYVHCPVSMFFRLPTDRDEVGNEQAQSFSNLMKFEHRVNPSPFLFGSLLADEDNQHFEWFRHYWKIALLKEDYVLWNTTNNVQEIEIFEVQQNKLFSAFQAGLDSSMEVDDPPRS